MDYEAHHFGPDGELKKDPRGMVAGFSMEEAAYLAKNLGKEDAPVYKGPGSPGSVAFLMAKAAGTEEEAVKRWRKELAGVAEVGTPQPKRPAPPSALAVALGDLAPAYADKLAAAGFSSPEKVTGASPSVLAGKIGVDASEAASIIAQVAVAS